MGKKKIFNDPVYGFINFPYKIIYDLLEHPYFQRLRRITQMSLSHYVYPGALHTRFHHALGATHLMTRAIRALRAKEVEITEEEAKGACIAILLHDIGHSPFSHTLEHSILNISHEDISLAFMEILNEEFDGKLSLALSIFKNEYYKPFLHQLVSSQLDMDRMDYLNRDSFFTGVAEGVIGYDRIIQMLDVRDDHLVVEEKGIYSIEKFLMARRIMYWQVYLHKAVLSADQMLVIILRRLKELVTNENTIDISKNLTFFLKEPLSKTRFLSNTEEIISRFARLDDIDIMSAIKNVVDSEDFVLHFMSQQLLNRKLHKIVLQESPVSEVVMNDIHQRISEKYNIDKEQAALLTTKGSESNQAYNIHKEEIRILKKSGEVVPITDISDNIVDTSVRVKYFFCHPSLE